MKENNFRKRLYCSVVAILSLFAVYGNNLHAADITYNPGMLTGVVTTLPQTNAVATGSIVTFTDMGTNPIPNFVVIGWTRTLFPVTVMSLTADAMARNMPGFQDIGSSLTVTSDMTFYAVWAVDKNNDGFPDYGGNVIVTPTFNGVKSQRPSFDDDDNDISLRSLPAWNNEFDLLAFDDSVYYVGCTYNLDTIGRLVDPLITFNGEYCFNDGKRSEISHTNDLYLVFEYEGVLEDSCMIGGPEQKPLTKIKIPAGTPISDIFEFYPFSFSSIQKDGLGILKMHFIDATTDTVPTNWITSMSNSWNPAATGWPRPFKDPKSGTFSDTLTIKFNIYNKPEFKSEVISQRVDLKGFLDMKHLNGTPLKYMMRCINDFRWKPADAPLSKAEREEIGDSVSICLRELDKTIGFQLYQKKYYLSPDLFNRTTAPAALVLQFETECKYNYNDSYFNGLSAADQNTVMTDAMFGYNVWHPIFMMISPPGTTADEIHDMSLDAALGLLGSTLTPAYPAPISLSPIISSIADADFNTVLGKRYADMIIVPAPCRETFCYVFDTRGLPVINREVYIPQVDGVTTNPGYGTQYVESQNDFNFSAKYATANPLKVTTNRFVNGQVEELIGQLNTNGEYEYVIRQVIQNIVLTFGPETVDNASISDGITVWSHNNTINIRVAKEDVAGIYSIAGQMVKRVELSEGENSVPMELGVYIVKLKDGSVHKVIVK